MGGIDEIKTEIKKDTMNKYEHLKRVNTYAKTKGFTVQYIYRQIKDGIIPLVEIDGVKFVDTSKLETK